MYNDFEKNNVNRIFLCNICLFFLSWFTDDPLTAGLKPSPSSDEINLDHSETNEKEENSPVSPNQYSSFISRITYFYHTKLVQKLVKNEFKINDLYEVDDNLKVNPAIKKFNYEFYKELENIKKLNHNSSFKKYKYDTISTLKVIWRSQGKNIMKLVILKTIGDLIIFCSPLLLNYMIEFIKDSNEPKWHGIVIVIGFVFSSILNRIFSNINNMDSFAIAINLRTCFSNLIFRKTLLLSPEARKKRTTGQIINLFSNDASTFSNFAPFFVYIWSAPFQFFLGFYILYYLVGML